ncbi:MAG: pyridoxamine 5'-phosphate oxidase [Burkholderiales bacterium]|nr:MAG: pyridoxamine 5'-phosphate oxidase [Burkholderiales bacterium]
MAKQDRRYQDVVEQIEAIRVAMMTTTEDDGRLRSRPMHVMRVDGDGTLWFLTNDGSHKLENLAHVNLSFADADDADWLSVCGSGEVVRDRATIAGLWSPMARPWFPRGADDPDLVALRVRADEIEYWDASSSRMMRLLEMARAAVTGTRYDEGGHGTVDPRA